MSWEYCSICFLTSFTLLGITIWKTDAADCTIPRGAQYRRSVYRPQYGSNTNRYSPGERISHRTKIVITCRKDINHDAVRDWTYSNCTNGRWVPVLPQCKVKRRCRAPLTIPHATASERITPYITFPHGTTVTYTCDVGKKATGNNTVVCEDGQWADTNFQCEDEVIDSLSCTDILIANGKVSIKEIENDVYDVTCDAGFRLQTAKQYRCRDGQWIGDVPQCVRASPQCKFPNLVRRRSVLKQKYTGEIMNSLYIDHWTLAVQTCTGKSRNGKPRTVKCVNGRWRPKLMKCRPAKGEKSSNKKRGRTYIDCEIPNIFDDTATYNDVISGKENAFHAGDMVQHGQIVERVCTEGFMLLPLVQLNTTLTTVCNNGEWTPRIQRCLRDENDTIFFDTTTEYDIETDTDEPTTEPTKLTSSTEHTTPRPTQTTITTTHTEPTTTEHTTPSSTQTTITSPHTEPTTVTTVAPSTTTIITTPEPDIWYRIRVKDKRGEHVPVGIVLRGELRTDVTLPLDQTDRTGAVREYNIKGRNVGKIKHFRIKYRAHESSDTDDDIEDPDFVSLYTSGDDEFYIDRFDNNHEDKGPSPLRRHCVRKFNESLSWEVKDWPALNELLTEFDQIQDSIDCRLRCIEETAFACRAAYYMYDEGHNQCYAFGTAQEKYYKEIKSSATRYELFRRVDSCP